MYPVFIGNGLCTADGTVLPAKSDSDVMFCLHSYQGLIIIQSYGKGDK